MLVKIRAADVNPVDIAVSHGVLSAIIPLTRPTLGSEIAGVVERGGRKVTAFAPGDDVHDATGASRGFAEFIALKSSSLTRKPPPLDFTEAAGLPIAVAAATAALDTADVGAATRVVVHAASGGVGSIAVQLAKTRGAHVIALVSPANLDFVRSLGADEAVDRTGSYEEQLRYIDVVLDAFDPAA